MNNSSKNVRSIGITSPSSPLIPISSAETLLRVYEKDLEKLTEQRDRTLAHLREAQHYLDPNRNLQIGTPPQATPQRRVLHHDHDQYQQQQQQQQHQQQQQQLQRELPPSSGFRERGSASALTAAPRANIGGMRTRSPAANPSRNLLAPTTAVIEATASAAAATERGGRTSSSSSSSSSPSPSTAFHLTAPTRGRRPPPLLQIAALSARVQDQATHIRHLQAAVREEGASKALVRASLERALREIDVLRAGGGVGVNGPAWRERAREAEVNVGRWHTRALELRRDYKAASDQAKEYSSLAGELQRRLSAATSARKKAEIARASAERSLQQMRDKAELLEADREHVRYQLQAKAKLHEDDRLRIAALTKEIRRRHSSGGALELAEKRSVVLEGEVARLRARVARLQRECERCAEEREADRRAETERRRQVAQQHQEERDLYRAAAGDIRRRLDEVSQFLGGVTKRVHAKAQALQRVGNALESEDEAALGAALSFSLRNEDDDGQTAAASPSSSLSFSSSPSTRRGVRRRGVSNEGAEGGNIADGGYYSSSSSSLPAPPNSTASFDGEGQRHDRYSFAQGVRRRQEEAAADNQASIADYLQEQKEGDNHDGHAKGGGGERKQQHAEHRPTAEESGESGFVAYEYPAKKEVDEWIRGMEGVGSRMVEADQILAAAYSQFADAHATSLSDQCAMQ
eukprot:jgi/Bigna1/81881/fgenesh1_pg.85_\